MVPVIKAALWILSQLFRCLLVIRTGLFRIGLLRQHQLSRPVISVGNLTLGGVGKTPIVEFIAKALKDKGIKPAILLRGYMANNSSAQIHESDEATMLKAKLDIPVLVGKDRAQNAKMFLEHDAADVFLLDDGFQHRQLSRDLDIVAIDTTNPWGNGHLLPRGILREPKKVLSCADILILTKANLGRERIDGIKTDIIKINPKALVVEAIHHPVVFLDMRTGQEADLALVRGQKICTVCSIGAPNSFIKTLVDLEADIDGHFAFRDHHVYCDQDIERIVALCKKQGIASVVITEKDEVKIKDFIGMIPDDVRVLVLKVEISIISEEEAFLERIYHIL